MGVEGSSYDAAKAIGDRIKNGNPHQNEEYSTSQVCETEPAEKPTMPILDENGNQIGIDVIEDAIMPEDEDLDNLCPTPEEIEDAYNS